MLEIKFNLAAPGKGKRIAGNFIHTPGLGGTIILDSEFAGDWRYMIDEIETIANPANFLAAFFCRIDKDEVMDRIIIDRKPTKIIREKPSTDFEAYHLNGMAFDLKTLNQMTVLATDVNGNDVELSIKDIVDSIPSESVVKLPVNKMYCKDTIINSILWNNQVDIESAKNFTPTLSKLIGKVKKEFKKHRGIQKFYVLASGKLQNIHLETTDKDTVNRSLAARSNKKDVRIITICRNEIFQE